MKITALFTALILALPLAAQSNDIPKRDQVRKQDGTATATGTNAQLRKRDQVRKQDGTGTQAQLRKRDGTGTGTCAGTGTRGANQGARKGRGR